MKGLYFAALACLAITAHGAPAHSAERDLSPPPVEAAADIAAALKSATVGRKRVILDFGGNWCTDCHVLDYYFHDPVNKPLLEANFILVHVNIGRLDANLDIAARYQIPMIRGVPAVAVLNSRGTLLFSQKSGEFEPMRQMQSGAVTAFLQRWKRPAS